MGVTFSKRHALHVLDKAQHAIVSRLESCPMRCAHKYHLENVQVVFSNFTNRQLTYPIYKMTISNNIKGSIYGCIAAISYGMNPLCALSLYEDNINSNTVLFYRFFFGTIMLGLLMLAQRRSFSLTRREAIVVTMLGAIFALSSITYFISFYYLGAGVAATLVFAYPVFTAILMALFFGERLKWPSIVAILMTIGGIALLYKGDDGKPVETVGIVVVMISALAYALYIILVNKSGIVMSSIKLTFYAMLTCLFFLTLYAIFSGTGDLELLHTSRQWVFGLLLGLVPTVISLVFMAMAINCIGSTPTAIMGALEPVTAVVLGMWFFGEVLTARLASGILLILVSVTLIILDNKLRAAIASLPVVRRGRLLVKKWRWK